MRKNRANEAQGAVCLCCDGPFLAIALFFADKLDRAAPSWKHDICLCSTEDLCLPAQFSDGRFRVNRVDPGPVYAALDGGVLSRATFLRRRLGDLLARDYARILSLDSDMFLEGDDSGDLFCLDLRRRAIGAVRDMQKCQRPDSLVSESSPMGKGALPYFNAGLLPIDTARHEAENIREKSLNFARGCPDLLHHHDQSLLNGVLLGNVTEISPVWNWHWVGIRPHLGNFMPPRLVRPVGHDKPWNDWKGCFAPRGRGRYGRFLAQHFPENGLWKANGRPILRKHSQMLDQSLIGYRALRRMQACLPDRLGAAA